jgi:hypothetical protein
VSDNIPEIALTPVEAYALKIVADYAESGVEDDIDEDGELRSDDKHDEAYELALAVIRGMRANPQTMLDLAKAGASA